MNLKFTAMSYEPTEQGYLFSASPLLSCLQLLKTVHKILKMFPQMSVNTLSKETKKDFTYK